VSGQHPAWHQGSGLGGKGDPWLGAKRQGDAYQQRPDPPAMAEAAGQHGSELGTRRCTPPSPCHPAALPELLAGVLVCEEVPVLGVPPWAAAGV